MSNNDLQKHKAVCPNCGAVNSQAWIEKNAVCKGIWIKCKTCKKEFELKRGG